MKLAELVGIAVILAATVFVAQLAAKKLAQRVSTTIKEVVPSTPSSVEEFLDKYPNVP